MGSMLDYLASTIIFGILILTVGRVQGNMSSTMCQSTYNLVTQRNGVELARQVEHDFLKIGHHIKGQKILYVDTSRIVFRADLKNNNDTALVAYLTGTTFQAAQTSNPNDFPLYRYEKGVLVKQSLGVTRFTITCYDSVNAKITTPITHIDSLNRIRSINVAFTVMSADPAPGFADSVWSGITWEKKMIPRNLTKIDL